MEARLQRRVQRYGWDLATNDYEDAWQAQLAPAQAQLQAMAGFAPGQRVLDVACGTGLVTFDAARAVGPEGRVLGVDISERMVQACLRRAGGQANIDFARMEAEALDIPDGSFDVALCALGLMYVPEPQQALREMRRVLRPGGRMVVAVWGQRERCGWADIFPIVDAEVSSEVCPLFFRLGQPGFLAHACAQAGFADVRERRLSTTLAYADGNEACDAAFVGGPVALAWSRFDQATRERARRHYLASIEPWRHGESYQVPGEFVIATATRD